MVIFLYRPEYYGLTTDSEGNNVLGTAEVILSKHRNGSLGTVKLKFIGKFTKFADLDVNTNFGEASFGNPQGEFHSDTNTITYQSKANHSKDKGSSGIEGDGGGAPF